MKKLSILVLCLAFCLLLTPVKSAYAYGSVGDSMLEFYPDLCEDNVALVNACAMCHNPGGFTLSPYGIDLAAESLDFAATESYDSDGDGRDNGTELTVDCTDPNDITSPVQISTFTNIKGLFK